MKYDVIVDCYTDEQSGLGVPPFLSVHSRYIAGALEEQKRKYYYLTIDDLRYSNGEKHNNDSYNKRIAEIDKEVDAELKHLEPRIAQWRLTPEANKKPKKAKVTKDGNEYGKSKNEQLSDPVKVSSPAQLAILIYDVLQYPPVDKDKPRSTDSDALEELVKKGFKLGEIILRRRGLVKLLNTYITAIPNWVSSRDNRLHAGFNTLGAATGRMSSSSPNLQNIPSHEKTIRLMFIASPGCSFVGGDFSLVNVG